MLRKDKEIPRKRTQALVKGNSAHVGITALTLAIQRCGKTSGRKQLMRSATIWCFGLAPHYRNSMLLGTLDTTSPAVVGVGGIRVPAVHTGGGSLRGDGCRGAGRDRNCHRAVDDRSCHGAGLSTLLPIPNGQMSKW